MRYINLRFTYLLTYFSAGPQHHGSTCRNFGRNRGGHGVAFGVQKL